MPVMRNFMPPARLSNQRRHLLQRAAADFQELQERRYPRAAALDWVGNRYRLLRWERQLLDRGVFPLRDALARLGKRVLGSAWRRKPVFVDGHNVQITVESVLSGRPWLIANDGAVRDISGLSAKYRMGPTTEQAMRLITAFLERFRPCFICFLFDAPMSHSGELAALYRRRLAELAIASEARAVPVPEQEFVYQASVIAGSDRVVLNASSEWLDLARRALYFSRPRSPWIDFSCHRP